MSSDKLESPYSASAGNLLAGLVIGLDHISICVRDINEAGRAWSALVGQPIADREDVVAQKTTAAFVRLPGGTDGAAIELISPMPGNAGLAKFLDKRGDAMHHIAIAVTDIRAALSRLKAANVPLIDQEPRPGACGHTVAFIHPKAMSGTLVELVEHASAPSTSTPA